MVAIERCLPIDQLVITTMKIFEPIEASGFFWLPEDPQNKLPGMLRISEKGEVEIHITCLLDSQNYPIEGSSFGPIIHSQDGNRVHKRILGIIKTEKSLQYVTLEDCSYKRWSTPFFDGIATSIIHANFAFYGVHYDSKEEIKFSEISFCVEGLDEWIGESSTNVKVRYGENSDLTEVRIDFSPPKKKSYSTSFNGMDVEFNFSYTIPSGFDVVETKITQKANVSIKSPNLYPFEEYRILLSRLQNFLCFAIDRTVSLTSVTGYSSEITQESHDDKKLRHPIQIYYASIPISESSEEFRRLNMLLPFPEISGQFDSILMQWLNGYDKNKHALDRYFSVMFGASKYLEIRFLLLIQGIEILHRQSSDQIEMDQETFKNLVAVVVNCAPKDKQDWLNEKLSFANELSLRKRLQEMLEPFWHLFKSEMNKKLFVNSVVTTRNYLTHASSDLENKSTEWDRLFVLVDNLEALFQLHLLQSIGIRQEKIENLAENHRRLRQKLIH